MDRDGIGLMGIKSSSLLPLSLCPQVVMAWRDEPDFFDDQYEEDL